MMTLQAAIDACEQRDHKTDIAVAFGEPRPYTDEEDDRFFEEVMDQLSIQDQVAFIDWVHTQGLRARHDLEFAETDRAMFHEWVPYARRHEKQVAQHGKWWRLCHWYLVGHTGLYRQLPPHLKAYTRRMPGRWMWNKGAWYRHNLRLFWRFLPYRLRLKSPN